MALASGSDGSHSSLFLRRVRNKDRPPRTHLVRWCTNHRMVRANGLQILRVATLNLIAMWEFNGRRIPQAGQRFCIATRVCDTLGGMSTLNLSADEFEKVISKAGIVLVDFWAAWCGPCRMFGPIFEAVSEQYPDMVFAKVDTEVEQQLSGSLGISSIPTLMAFKDGVLLFNQAGALPAASLEQLIKALVDVDMDEVRAKIEAEK